MRKLLVMVLVCATTLSLNTRVIAQDTSTSPAIRLTPMIGSWAPAIAQGRATQVGVYTATALLTVTLALRPRDAAGLRSFAQAVSDPHNQFYRHYLTHAQIEQRYGATPSTIDAVAAWVRSQGVTAVTTRTTDVTFAAPARRMATLFHIQIGTWRLSTGRMIFGPTTAPAVPQSLSGAIMAIIGLDNETLLQPRDGRLETTSAFAAGRQVARGRPEVPQTSPAGTEQSRSGQQRTGPRLGSGVQGGYTPQELRLAYDIAGLFTEGTQGQGQTIDLYELDGYQPSTINTYDTQYGISGGSVTPYLCVTDTSSVYGCTAGQTMAAGSAEDEVESDIEVIQAIAPRATIHVYQSDQNGSDWYSLWTTMLSAGDARIVSTSWGFCELDLDQPTLDIVQAQDILFQEAVAAGIGIFAASGDSGSTDCAPDSGVHATTLAVDNPASDPFVTAVGGTSLYLDSADQGYGSEVVWNSGTFLAGGGGVSVLFSRPWYQTALAPTQLNGATGRMLPDVSANADPYTGYSIYTACGGSPCWTVIGGTSLATPLWAAVMALANQVVEAQGGMDLGFTNPTLYSLGEDDATSSAFHDVTSGSNDANPSDGSASSKIYSATVGFDMASGWGSPDVSLLISALLAAQAAVTTTLSLQSGWNLVGLPVSPTVSLTARSALPMVVAAGGGGSIAEIACLGGRQLVDCVG